jgi:hypothetical protein
MTALELIAIATVVFAARVVSDKAASWIIQGLCWLQIIILCFNAFGNFSFRRAYELLQ